MPITNPHNHAARALIADLSERWKNGGPVDVGQVIITLGELVDAIEYEAPRPSLDQAGDPAERAKAAAGVAHYALLDLQAMLAASIKTADDDDEPQEANLLRAVSSAVELIGGIGIGILHTLRAGPERRAIIGHIGEPRPTGGRG